MKGKLTDTIGRAGSDNSTVLLLLHMRPASLDTLSSQHYLRTEDGWTDLIGTSQVNSHDLIPHLLVHVDECLVPEDTGIGNEDMNGTEGINCSLDDSITIFGRTDSSDSLASN